MKYKVMARTKHDVKYCIAKFMLACDARDFIKLVCLESNRYWIEEDK